ncbi:DIS3-like exonuclease 2 isoform X1 [Benincasa hispida]|uniref:DIS3-like exonuclease 2 isoform X1 n=1 Tax=Benincasa hispida TaxID=102211 RepID=UPI001902BD45|nr:DIS3-like exonuclease 2 isoform X1 [Benincasa hispida]
MRGAVEQSTPDRNEDGDKEKKKKRRSNRRSKQNASLSTSASCNSVNGITGEASESMENGRIDANLTSPSNYSSLTQQAYQSNHPIEHGLTRRNKIAFSSLPPLHISEEAELSESQNLKNQNLHSLDDGGRIIKSCPEQIAFGRNSGISLNQHSPPADVTENNSQRKYFPSHWSMDDVNEGLQKGDIFKALFRVNAHNRLEAYCKIDGLPVDVLINGIASQNRAVEGDIVAIKVDPFTSWTRMKGTSEAHNNMHSMEDVNLPFEVAEKDCHNCKGKNKVDADVKSDSFRSSSLPDKRCCSEDKVLDGTACDDLLSNYEQCDVNQSSVVYPSQAHFSSNQDDVSKAVGRICAVINLYPAKRPTGRVVTILEKSRLRETVVGHLNVKKFLSFQEIYVKENTKFLSPLQNCGYVQLIPNDARFPIMMVLAEDLPDCIKKRLDNGDLTVESELVAARIHEWVIESSAPRAQVLHVLGRGSEVESHIDAILFENAIRTCEFSHDSLSCIPHTPWKIPQEELQCRRDIRNLCIFTIDPSSASDLDDALSVQILANGIFRVGIHVADVSHFVLPGTALDKEAQIRSMSVYLLQRKIPMLPPLLSENIGSLNPGVDRLAFSLFLDINNCGDVKECWIGRTVICSCCKLSYEQAQDIIDGLIDSDSSKILRNNCPQLHGQFAWHDVISSVKLLHEISKTLKEKRFRDGALRLENSKIIFLYDECGIPYDSTFYEQKDSNFLVEEFMLLANTTVAEVISRTFPDSALLRRHPDPILRKLREFESFCSRHGFELDTSSSVQFQQSLEQIRIKLHDDPLLFDILTSYATRPMQLATYFCSGELKDGEKGSHYALAVPLYTHFTSPLRRYPDIVVHRTLAAAIEAEMLYLKHRGIIQKVNSDEQMRCFTGISFDKDAADSLEGREALSSAALRHGVPCSKLLSDVAVHCNNRKLASKHVADGCEKLYMWALLKKKKILFSDARVLGLGPRFMSVYIQKLAIERRIYYDEVEGLAVEWLDTTSTLVLSFFGTRRSHRNRGSIKWKALEDVALIISPCDQNIKQRTLGVSPSELGGATTGGSAVEQESNLKSHVSDTGVDPAVFPLTVRLLSTIPVALHAVGGDDGPIDIGVRLYMSSYLR